VTSTRVLVLDGQTTQALACVRSLGRAGYRPLVGSRQRRPLAGWSRWASGSRRIGGETVEAFAELRAWAVERGVGIVLPTTERSCLLLNLEREEWETAGIRLGCADPQILARAFDKGKTLEAALACGVAIPPTRQPRSESEAVDAARELGLPCVVKARFSEALVGTTLLRGGGASYVSHATELLPAIRQNRQGPHWPIIQGFVGGQGKGVSGLCDRGRPLALFAHERLRDVRPTGSGSTLRRSIPLDDRLREPVERLLAEMEWHGPVMVEFRDDGDGPPRLMEVNGRFWGSVQLAISAGVDVPRMWLDLLCDRQPAPTFHYAHGLTLRWLWGDAKRLLKILEGPPAGYPGSYPTRSEGFRELFRAQPAGTRMETWDRLDPWPAAGEWVQGIGELVEQGWRRRATSAASSWGADDMVRAEIRQE
jgi:predicted ATP-grasp superfamily ATP-dependent carboligase